MHIYHGLSLSPGVAIASAARLTAESGVPQLATERLRRIGEFLQKAGLDLPEPDQVILVAEGLPPGFGFLAMPGLEIVGMALGGDLLAAAPCPTVGQIGEDLLSQTEEGEIVIVDGDRGRVYVSPDAQTLARYQGPTRRARRFFLEPGHVSARRGSNGKEIAVFAAVTDADELRAAIADGADGVLIPEQNSLLHTDEYQTASEQLLQLQDMVMLTGGKFLVVHAPLERVALSALARAASSGPVHLALSNITQAAEARAELDALEPELEERDIAFGRVVLEAFLQAGDDYSDSLADVDGIIVANRDDLPKESETSGLTITTLIAISDGPAEIMRWLAAGVTRLVTSRFAVQYVKECVRQS